MTTKKEIGIISRVFENILIALLYFLTARLGQMLAIPPGNVTPVWIPSGIILAAVLIRGKYIWPGIFLGAFMGNAWAYMKPETVGAAIFSGSMNGIGDSLCAIIGAYLIKVKVGDTRPLSKGFDVVQFIVYGALFGGLISAVFGVTGLWVAGFIPSENYFTIFMTWLVGDAVGVLIITPFFLTFKDWSTHKL